MGVVFILGAGASADAGAPLMGNFMDRARDLWATESIENEIAKDSFKRVFKLISSLQSVHSKCYIDLRNVESILAALDMGRTLDWLPGYDESQIDQLIKDVSTLICLTIEKSTIFPINEGGALQDARPYKAFADLIHNIKNTFQPRRNASVITFNYDLACDRSLIARGLNPDYCLERRKGMKIEGTPLLKLHGSLNWVRCEQCKEKPIHTERVNRLAEHCFPGNAFPENRRVSQTTLPISRWLREANICEHLPADLHKVPFIVPPTWDKTAHHRAITPVWRAAAEVLSEAEYIFVIGYSFPGSDAFFHYLYGLGSIGKNPLRRFVVFNPDTKGVENRFKGLLGRAAQDVFDYQARTFKESIAEIINVLRK